MDCSHCCFKVSDITFWLIYRSPNAPPRALSALTEQIRATQGSTIMIGDFNLPDVNWETGEVSKRTEDFKDAVDNAMMEQLVDFPTHVKGN